MQIDMLTELHVLRILTSITFAPASRLFSTSSLTVEYTEVIIWPEERRPLVALGRKLRVMSESDMIWSVFF